MPWLGTLLSATLILICAVVGLMLRDSRLAALNTASIATADIASLVSQEIERNFEFYDLSIRGAVDDLKLPDVQSAPQDLRRLVLFDRAATAPYLGAMRVLDATGHVILDSLGGDRRDIGYSDRDYFKAQAARADAGLFIGGPIKSRTDGQEIIGLSRRVNKANGDFDGVVVGTLRLAYFHHLFSKIHFGPHSAVTLFRDDGLMLMRRPFDADMIGRVFKPGLLLDRAAHAHEGEYQAVSAIDGMQRLVHFERVGSLPLIVVATAAVEDIYADWWPRAISIASVTALSCAVIVALAFFLRKELRLRIEAEAALGLLADEDGLTGLANRRRFDEKLRKEWSSGARSAAPLALLMIDADQFKIFNDSFGHPAGDDALKALAGCLAGVSRPETDLAARFGGEEFAVILPSTDAATAMRVAERIRRDVLALELPHPQSAAGCFTVSIGVTACVPRGGTDRIRSFVAAADSALYAAKESGRNRSKLGSSEMARAA